MQSSQLKYWYTPDEDEIAKAGNMDDEDDDIDLPTELSNTIDALMDADPLCEATDDVCEFLDRRTEDGVDASVTWFGQAQGVVLHWDDESEESREWVITRDVLCAYLTDTEINSGEKLLQAAEKAVEFHQNFLGTKENPFLPD